MLNLRMTKDGFSVYARIGDAVAKFNFYHTFVRTMGMTNTVEHLKRYVLFMDVDNMKKFELENLLWRMNSFVKEIDKAYGLKPLGIGKCILLKTRNDGMHWHVIDPSIYLVPEMINLLYFYSPLDIKYLACGLRQCGPDKGGWTLRIDKKDDRDEKIEFDSILNFGEPERYVSKAHVDFLKSMHKIDYPVPKRLLLQTDLEVDRYYTTNVVKK